MDNPHTFGIRSLVSKNRSTVNIYDCRDSVRKDFGSSLPEWFWMGEPFCADAAKTSARAVAL